MAVTDTTCGLAIVVGGFVNALGLVRSLAALKVQIIVISTQPFDIAQYSRHVSESHRLHDSDNQPERLVNLLKRCARQWKGAVVIPTDDAAISCLSLYHDQLTGWYRLAIPPLDSVSYILNRSRMLKAAADVGMRLPKNHGLVSRLVKQKASLQYPVVVKPLRAGEFSLKFGRKLFLLHNPADFRDCSGQLAAEAVDGSVFEVIPGPDSDIYAHCVYIDQQGQTRAECTIRKIRQSPPGFGVARVAEITRSNSLLQEQSIELLRYMGFRGFASLEFKHDRRDGSYNFFEVNGRSVIYNSLLRQGNLDIAKLTLADHVAGQVSAVETTQWPGVWIHLHADFLRSLQNWRREGLTAKDYLNPYRRKKLFAVWSTSDLLPFNKQWSRTFGQACSSLYRKSGMQEKTSENQ